MGFGRKKKKRAKFIYVGFLVVMIAAILSGASYYHFSEKEKRIIKEYEVELTALKQEIQGKLRLVYVPKSDLRKGTVLTEDNIRMVEVTSSIEDSKYISREAFGKTLKVDMEKDIPIMKTMVGENNISNALREVELGMLTLPSNMNTNDYVDIRIGFPNGEDYIVLSKKRIENVNLTGNTIWLWLEETEVLRLSSAIVDAYLNKGTKLYTLKYVQPDLQESSETNYPVNMNVLNLINENPNIIEEVTAGLNSEARESLDNMLKELSNEQMEKVENGIAVEESNRDQVVIEEANDTRVEEEKGEEQEKATSTNSNAENITDQSSGKKEDENESFF